MYKLLFLLALFIEIHGMGACYARGEKQVTVQYLPVYNGEPLVLEAKNYPCGGDSVRINTFRFYVSKVSLLYDGKEVWHEVNSYHLTDAASDGNKGFVSRLPGDIGYNQIRFLMGIDSATNAAGAKDGDLDATKGMYWAWQSGYINMKLEGTSPLCKTRKNVFQYHLGGFRDGNGCAQPVSLPIEAAANNIAIQVDVALLLQHTDLKTMPEVMVPGAAAAALSKKALTMFKIVKR